MKTVELTPINTRRMWAKILLLTALGAFIIETSFFLHGNMFGREVSIGNIPYTLHTLWEIAALLLAVYFTFLLTNDNFIGFIGYLIVGLTFGSFFIFLLWLVAPTLSSQHFTNWNLPRPNYYGVQIRATMDQHMDFQGQYSKMVYDDLMLLRLYPKENGILESIDYWKQEGYEYVDAKGFLTWQAGLADGFEPSATLVPRFNSQGLQNRLILMLTVGPVTVFELLIRGIYHYFLVILIPQIILYRRTKKTLVA